jgi:phage baseplate assembly protein W
MVYEIGTDINSQWTFKNGDLQLITDDENLKQSIYNRITTTDGVFRHFYQNYGSVLETYLGFKKDKTTLEFMKIELERVLLQDPRLQNFKLDLEYHEKGVQVDLRININGTNMNLNFITDGTTITEER